MSSTKQLATRGAIWTLIGYGASQILRFGSSITLAHFLSPKLFGLMTLISVFIVGLHLFSDIGIGTSVIRSKRAEEPDFYNTAWTLQVIRSLWIWGCCLLLAWPVSQFYQEPQLLWLLPIVSLTTVIDGFGSTGVYLLNRRLVVKQLALIELAAQLLSVLTMITLAYFYKSVWALVAGGFASSIFNLIISHRINPGPAPNRFHWDRDALKEIASFGRWIFASTAFTFLANQSDRLVLGRLLSLDLLGVYGIAFNLASVPSQLTSAVAGKVIYPSYNKFVELPRDEFRQKIMRTRLPIILLTAVGIAILVCFGDILVSVLYDERYADAKWMLPMLALGVWLLILNTTVDPALLALGNPQYITYGCFWSAVFIFGGMIIGFKAFGTVGAIAAVPLSNLPLYVVVQYGLWQEKLSCLAQDFKVTGLLIGLLIVFVSIRNWLGMPLHFTG